MPTLKKYVDQPGYYVRTAVDGRPVTYQLTRDGQLYVQQVLNLGDESKLDWEQLKGLVSRGWAYTGGTGPGEVLPDHLAEQSTPRVVAETFKSAQPQTNEEIDLLSLAGTFSGWRWANVNGIWYRR